jgi:NADH-quinone oxidoreductase subunit C
VRPVLSQQRADALAERLGEDVTVETSYDVPCVDVPVHRWVEALMAARDELGCRFFDWLSAVDELEAGFAVVAHVWSVPERFGLLVRTRVPRENPTVPTVTGVYAGASWHERETAEMFGIAIEGHPRLDPLLLPEGFEGHPLRKEFVLASRAAKAWPGAKEPGESGEPGQPGRHGKGSPSRRKQAPPGVPDPTWGPRREGQAAVGQEGGTQ